MSDRLIYLDVDGPLNPYGAPRHRRPEGYTSYRMSPPSWIAQQEPVQVMRGRVKPLLVWLRPDAGEHLLQLANDTESQLVWATTWEHDANDYIGPHVGLPKLEVVEFGDARSRYRECGQHWKLDTLIDHAAGRSFVWLDDEITSRDHDYLDRRYNGRDFGAALALAVSPLTGLLPAHYDAVRAWVREFENGDSENGDAA
jgi:hypothetical protein